MARRSSSSRWSRPATGKQIAALKSHGKYDGKYYSMGRASQAIGGSSAGGRRSVGGSSSGAAYSGLAAPGGGPSTYFSTLLGASDGLDALLQPALGMVSESRLATSGSGPTSLLSQVLGVPDDLDSLVQAAMDGTNVGPGEDPIESVLYTIRSDDSHSTEPHIVVEAEVVRDSAFEGLPSLQVRFVGNAEAGTATPEGSRQLGAGTALGYRPAWTPVLVRKPADLAEQMRVRWREAVGELEQGVDPRMETFLAGAAGMESALAVLRSGQSAASKFVLLQGLMDPDGVLQFEGLGLDAGTFADQIRKASEGDEDALSWLAHVQQEEVLTSLAEVTGIDLAAEADFRLSRWREQAMALIEGVTMSAQDADFDFSAIRSLLTMRADTQARRDELRAKIAESRSSSAHEAVESAFSSLLERLDSDESSVSSGGYGLLEDWFFEETRHYLEVRFRQSLPAQFATALVSRSAEGDGHAALVTEVRRMADEASVNQRDYLDQPEPATARQNLFGGLYGRSSGGDRGADRTKRIVQAVRRVIAELDAVRDDDLGTLIVAQEVLAYAKWKRDELRAVKQLREADRQKSEAVERAMEARRRSDAALQREEAARTLREAAEGVERVAHQYAEALSRTPRSISIQDPLSEASESAASARGEAARAREVAAGEWLSAAEQRERWAVAEAAAAATPTVDARLDAERDAAVAEQGEAKSEAEAARTEQREAEQDAVVIANARAKFEVLIRPVRDENRGRAEAEFERQRQERARQDEELRQRAEALQKQQAAERERQEAANRRQEEINQRQQERAGVAKEALARELERLRALPATASVWRRKSLAATRSALEETISKLQDEIVGPLVPPRTRSKVWPNMLGKSERYLGTVKKVTDYGAFVSLPAGTDGLLRASGASPSLTVGQRVIVEITDMPYGKPIVLKLISG